MTIHSMTGFAAAVGEVGVKRVHLDIRSVNHRFLDLQFKMPDDLRPIEAAMREAVAKTALRGKVECRIQIQAAVNHNDAAWQVNEELVGQLAALNSRLRKQYGDLGKLTVAELLRFPGVLAGCGADDEAMPKMVLSLLDEALVAFAEARRREGEKLAQHLLERLAAMREIVHGLAAQFPELLQAHMDKVRGRLKEALDTIDDNRLQQEFALFMQKADVDEEFSRLLTHIDEVERIVQKGKGSVGKRLDFLMQELNREANTLGSKAIASECTQASVELKVLIEQMREQVQNIE